MPKDARIPQFGPDHQAGMIVPRGGSICAKCKYLVPGEGENGRRCREDGFIAWDGSSFKPPKPAGSDEIPASINEYCSDWFEARKGTLRAALQRVS